MGFQYDPKDASQALPGGIYDASIHSATCEKEDGSPLVSSTKGEPMQLVVFEVYAQSGNRKLFQYFTNKSMIWLYRKLAHALGAAEQFSAKQFDAANYIGANLRLDLDVEENSKYGEQNRISEFLPKNAGVAATNTKNLVGSQTAPGVMPADDIPF